MKIKAFKGLRPVVEKVELVASKPYDVLNSAEAREEAAGNPLSFLNVVKPEITLPENVDPHDMAVYEAGRGNFKKLVDESVFVQDADECFYIYELVMDGHSQSGIVGCASLQDYQDGKIKMHEQTTPDKETDRKEHIRVSSMNAEPLIFAYKSDTTLDEIVAEIQTNDPIYDFVAEDGIIHRFWVVKEKEKIEGILSAFDKMPETYVADGHHRTVASARAGDELKNANPAHTGDEGYNYFLAVHFPDDQLRIMDYNRVVKDLNGHSAESFLQAISSGFEIEKTESTYKPSGLHEFSMYLDGNWYRLTAKEETFDDNDPIKSLDVTVLSDHILKPHLNIHDLRTDKRIEFVGGMRGMTELQKRVDSGEMKVAFALYPVSMQQVMDIADNDLTMPPKVTWFEPKLRSGLVVYSHD